MTDRTGWRTDKLKVVRTKSGRGEGERRRASSPRETRRMRRPGWNAPNFPSEVTGTRSRATATHRRERLRVPGGIAQ